MTLDNLSLRQLFDNGQSMMINLEQSSLPTMDTTFQKQVRDCIEHFDRADDLVSRLNMFSSNELLDDINPNDLKYLLVPAYLGDLVMKKTQEDRGSILRSSKDYFERFLSTCKDHQLLARAKASGIIVNQKEESRLSSGDQRQQKIKRYKYEKEIREKITQLREQKGHSEDDEAERDIALALIDLQIVKALEHLRGIDQELVMVKEREAMLKQDQDRGQSKIDDTRQPSRAQWGHNKPLLSPEGRPLQPFVITTRERLKDQVFRPGWSLPTMTVDQYLEQEMERGNIISGGGKEPPAKPEIDDNDEAALNAETMKQREWDEFKEANPRGSGNRGNKG